MSSIVFPDRLREIQQSINKANLRDLIAATGLVIQIVIFCPCDLEIAWITLKNYRTPVLCHFKLCASFCSHQSFQTWVTVPEYTQFGSKSRLLYILLNSETEGTNKPCWASVFPMYLIWMCIYLIKIFWLDLTWLEFVVLRDIEIWRKTIGHLLYATSSFIGRGAEGPTLKPIRTQNSEIYSATSRINEHTGSNAHHMIQFL